MKNRTTRQAVRSIGQTIILLAVFSTASCGLLKKEQKLASEAADATAAASAPVSVTINNQPYGTTADLTDFRRAIGGIMRERESTGLFIEGTNQVANTVHINPDPKISIGNFADLLLAVNESGGKGYLAVNTEQSGRSTEPQRPNPYTLIVSAGERQPEPPYLHVVRADEVDRSSIAPSVQIVTDARDVKRARATDRHLEISAAGEYFINGPTVSLSGMDFDEVEIVQRPIEKGELGRNIESFASSSRKAITIIASQSAHLQSLLDVFAIVDATQFQWNIIVRRNSEREKK